MIALDMAACPSQYPTASPPEPGLVYTTTKGTYNLIVAIRGNTAYCLVFNGSGEFTGCTQYGVCGYFADRSPVGRVDLPNLLSVEWFHGS